MRNISFDGRLGADARVLNTKDGKPYIRFNVANNTFSAGQEKTEWFDVTCYDDYIVSKADKLKKGVYVIITGPIASEVNIKDGKVFLNHYVRAIQVERPSFGKREETESNQQSEQVSTYTGSTPSVAQRPVEEPKITVPSPAPAQEPAYSVSIEGSGETEDLPF